MTDWIAKAADLLVARYTPEERREIAKLITKENESHV